MRRTSKKLLPYAVLAFFLLLDLHVIGRHQAETSAAETSAAPQTTQQESKVSVEAFGIFLRMVDNQFGVVCYAVSTSDPRMTCYKLADLRGLER
jgi:hypothetical protein